jgi:endogenous inhibitor of DNA gyrase (YacG/DUF329 family)
MKLTDIPMVKCPKCGATKMWTSNENDLKHFPWCPRRVRILLCQHCGQSDWKYGIEDGNRAPLHPKMDLTWWSVCPGSHQPLIERKDT